MDLNLGGKVALVTGGLNGIGKEISRALLSHAATVNVADILSPEIASSALDDLNLDYWQLNVTSHNDCKTVVDKIVEKYGKIDILINCAGILKTKSVLDSSIEDWDEIVKVNLSGIFYALKAVMPHMVGRRSGKIINLASVSSVKGGGALGNVLYGTTKAGVVAFTQGFARELAPYQINVNAISPGVVDGTQMVSDAITDEIRQKIISGFPFGRLPKMNDVANLALFLSSDLSNSITGQNMVIDCGFLVR